METFMAGAAGVEIFLTSVILAVLMAVWAMQAMFRLMSGAGRPAAVRTEVPRGQLVLARVRASSGQMSLRTR